MLLFSEYLKAKHLKSLNSGNIFNNFLLYEWLEENRNPAYISALGLDNLYQQQFEHFEKSLYEALHKFYQENQNQSASNYTRLIDLGAQYFRKSFIYMVQLKSKEQPWSFPSHTFEASQSGVSIETYLHTKSGVKNFETSHSGLGNQSKNKGKDKKATFEDNLSQFCVDNKHISIAVGRIKKNDTHGEEAWMGNHALKLIAYLKTLKDLEMVKTEDQNSYDTDWLQNFTNLPRIEFVLNTSPCNECQGLFKKFREKLNEAGIFIPILIYSIFPYNTDEVEMSQVNVLSFQGEFIQTKLFMDTPYNQTQRPVLDIALDAKLKNALEFDANVYPLLLKLQLESDSNTQKTLFTQLRNQIQQLSLSKIDRGVIKAFLNHFPSELRNITQDEYNICTNTLKNISPSKDAILTASGLENLFEKIFETQDKSLKFDESEVQFILQLTAMLGNHSQQTNQFVFHLVFSSIFYICTKLVEDNDTSEDLASYVIGGQV